MKLRSTLILLIITALCSGNALSGQWIMYDTDNSGIASNDVRAVTIDSIGAIWFGTANGLSRFDGENWTTYTDADNLANNSIRDIDFEITDYGPEIWVATDGGVSVVNVTPDAVTFATPYTTENTGILSNTVTSSVVAPNHAKWFGHDVGVSKFDGSEWTTYDAMNMLNVETVISIAVAANGWLYLGTDGGGANRFDGVTTASPYDTEWTGIASDTVTAGLIASDGNKWFGTDQGISIHESEETKDGWSTFTTADGLAGNYIHAIAEDSKSIIWAGTDSGLSSYDGDWLTWPESANMNIYSIAVNEDDGFWLGTDKGAAYWAPYPTSVENEEAGPEALTLVSAYPNPFNPSTMVEFTLADAGEVELAIFNLAGQKVRSLIEGTRSAGVHAAVWNGCDENGNRVSSGVYIARARMGNMSSSASITMLK